MSNGIGPNPLNDISRVYLDQIVEKKKDDTYLEPDMKKRQANNEKARKELAKGPQMKNPHFEEKQQGWDAVNSLADAFKEMHQDTVDEEKKKLPYVKMFRKAGNLGRDGSPEAMERSKKITGVMNKNAERVAAHRERDDAAKEAKRLRKEALDPVGQEDKDIDNDGDHDKTDKYLHKRRKAIGKAIKKRMKEEKELTEIHGQAHKPHEVPDKNLKGLVKKAVKRIDTDVDGDTDHNDKAKGELGEFIPGVGNKRLYSSTGTKTAKESYSWRQDLSEIMTDDIDSKPIKEKKVNNKVKINPKLGESVENLGGELIEMVEIVDILAEITDQELKFVSDKMIDQVVEEFFAEALEDGDDIDLLQDTLCESIDMTLNLLSEGYYDSAVATSKANAAKNRASVLDRVKSSVKKGAKVARKAVVKGAEYVGKAAGHAKNLAKDVGSAAKKGYQSTQSDSSSEGETRKPQTYRNQGVTKKGPGLLSKIGSKLKSGLKSAVGKGARAVSRGARNLARRMDEDASMSPQELSLQKKKANVDKMIANKRKQELGKQTIEQPAKAMGEETEIEEGIGMTMVRAMGTPPAMSRRYSLQQALLNREVDKTAAKNKKRRFSGKAVNPKASKAEKMSSPAAKTTAKEEVEQVDEKLNMKKEKMGSVIKDFYKSDAPQFKGKSKEKRREMAIAAKLTAERGGRKLGEETIDERTRYAKETGKDPQTGKPSEKGGTLGGDDRHSKVMRHMQKNLRKTGGLMSSRKKAIQPQGKKKEKGAKPKFKTEPTPVDKIRAKLARKRAPKPDIGSRFD